jgi:4-oxalocrotonate tautomerase
VVGAIAAIAEAFPVGQARELHFLEDTAMPDVHICWLEGRTVEQKRKVAERITQVLTEEAGAKPESTHIVFVDIPHTNFASGGMLVADRNKKTQWENARAGPGSPKSQSL